LFINNRFYRPHRLSYIPFMAIKLVADSITEAVYRRIRADLLSCRLRPGEKLGISKLKTDLGISLCAVREALARLTSEGFVLAEPQKGFRAAPISVADLRDLTQARVEIESLCLRRAIINGGLEWETRIVAAAHRLSKMPGLPARVSPRYREDWDVAHDEFHASLVAACGNRTLLTVREQLFAKSARYRWLSISLTEEKRDLKDEHQAIADASLERNVDKASALLTIHIKETSKILVAAMGAAEATVPAQAAKASQVARIGESGTA
jgi:DNA-binding GntR family transcriptional regulator